MTELDILNLVGNYAFPIIITLFVLLRLEKSMKLVEAALLKMSEAMIRLENNHNLYKLQ
jgi:hypothetical protein